MPTLTDDAPDFPPAGWEPNLSALRHAGGGTIESQTTTIHESPDGYIYAVPVNRLVYQNSFTREAVERVRFELLSVEYDWRNTAFERLNRAGVHAEWMNAAIALFGRTPDQRAGDTNQYTIACLLLALEEGRVQTTPLFGASNIQMELSQDVRRYCYDFTITGTVGQNLAAGMDPGYHATLALDTVRRNRLQGLAQAEATIAEPKPPTPGRRLRLGKVTRAVEPETVSVSTQPSSDGRESKRSLKLRKRRT